MNLLGQAAESDPVLLNAPGLSTDCELACSNEHLLSKGLMNKLTLMDEETKWTLLNCSENCLGRVAGISTAMSYSEFGLVIYLISRKH